MKKTRKRIIIIWISIILVFFLLKWDNIWSEYNVVENIFGIILYLSWIIPILLIFYIKRKTFRYITLSVYVFILLLFAFPIIFVGIFAFGDLITNNGYSKVYEKQLSKNEKFVIYRTPDKGALGGSNKIYTVDKKLFLGFDKRKTLKPSEYKLKQGVFSNIDTVYYKSDTMIIDNNKNQ